MPTFKRFGQLVLIAVVVLALGFFGVYEYGKYQAKKSLENKQIMGEKDRQLKLDKQKMDAEKKSTANQQINNQNKPLSSSALKFSTNINYDDLKDILSKYNNSTDQYSKDLNAEYNRRVQEYEDWRKSQPALSYTPMSEQKKQECNAEKTTALEQAKQTYDASVAEENLRYENELAGIGDCAGGITGQDCRDKKVYASIRHDSNLRTLQLDYEHNLIVTGYQYSC